MHAITVKSVVEYLEGIAPLSYQEGYDNSGLLVGRADQLVTGALVTLDCTEAVVDEAAAKNCNLIVSHHPIIFGGLKKLTGANVVERTVIKAIQSHIALYAAHTNLDNVRNGVCSKMAERLGMKETRILAPKTDTLAQLVCFVPPAHAHAVAEAMHTAGAGSVGAYEKCSFRTNGMGTFLPTDKTNPHIGKRGKVETVEEVRLEMILPRRLQQRVLEAIRSVHPYEEVAHYLVPLSNAHQEVGAGLTGLLERPMGPKDFLGFLKERMQTACIRHTAMCSEKVQRIALCGGAGSALLPAAIDCGADVYISADFKYHEFFNAEGQIIIADIGHYESEQFTKTLLQEDLKEKFANFAVFLSQAATNPISYF